MSMDADTTSTRRMRFPQMVAIVVGLMFLAPGLWALLDPRSFFDTLAMFEPYNTHFIHDIGAFQLGLGAVLLIAAFAADALLAALSGAAVASVAHLASHVVDRDLGGTPATDIPFFALMALVLVAAAAVRARGPKAKTEDGRGAAGAG